MQLDRLTNRLAFTTTLLVLANFAPLVGVLFFDWSMYQVVLLFWAENLVIGFFTVARLLSLCMLRQQARIFSRALFFLLHYGSFSLAHGFFLVTIFAPEEQQKLNVAQTYWIPILGLMVSHGASFVLNFFVGQEYRTATEGAVMLAPYKRVVILHITILLGGMLVIMAGEPLFLMLVFIGMKILVDVKSHRAEHLGKADAANRKRRTGREDSDVFRTWS